jgi:hypothetical protein
VVALSYPSGVGWVYRSVSGHKILTANHVLSMQQINPLHHYTTHLVNAVYVYPRRLAGSFEGQHALAVCTSQICVGVFQGHQPSGLRLDLAFCLLSLFIFTFYFLFCCLIFLNSPILSLCLQNFCNALPGCDAANNAQCAVSAQRRAEAMNGCSPGSPLLLLTPSTCILRENRALAPFALYQPTWGVPEPA